MQQPITLRRAARATRNNPWRHRNVAKPHKSRPLPLRPSTTYGVRVRNAGRDRKTWAALVKQARAVMSGAEMARRLGVDRATIWRWETGRQKPERVEIVEAFARLFRISLDEALEAAGMRPATDEVAPIPELRLDPDVLELQRMLDDPRTPEPTKQQIREMVRALKQLAATTAAQRRRAG